MKKILSALFVLVLMLSACIPTTSAPQGQSVEDIVAATFQAMTAAAPTATQPTPGIPVSLNGLSFTIPIGLGTGSAVSPNIPPVSNGGDMPWWENYPAYNTYPIIGYPLEGNFQQAELFVFPANEYAQMNEDAGKRIQALRDLLANPASLSTVTGLPFLPTYNAAQVFHSNAQMISFQNGTGVRFITMYSQFPGQIVNGAVFYTFQGLTSDGTYYVSAVLPVLAPFLMDPGPNAVLPADGVPFDQNNFDAYPAYLDAVTAKLNSADLNIFNPALPSLDALIQSVLISPHTVSAPAAPPTTAPQVNGAQTNNQFSFPSFGVGLKFFYPTSLNEGLSSETIAASALGAPWELDYPEHVAVYFSAYTSTDFRDSNTPGIRIFRVADLNAMDPELVPRLQSQTAQNTQHDAFPNLPYPGHNVDAQFKNLSFQNGTGYRFLSSGSFAAQAPGGTGLTYTFTGLTSDGKYLISLRISVNAPMIADLADGHAYVSQEDATASTNALNARVNSAADNQFSPSLSILDALVASIIITQP